MGTSLPATSLRDGRRAAVARVGRRTPAVGGRARRAAHPVDSDPSSRQVGFLVRRVVARGLDAFTVLFVMLAVVLLGLAPLMRWTSDRIAPEPWGTAFAATLVYALISAVYEVTFLALRGQTPGKDVCKLKVVVAGTDSAPSWRRALVRTLPVLATRLVPGVLAGSLAVIPLGCTATARRRRAAHDLLAGTEVIAYDADHAEHELPHQQVDRADLAETYGPRGLGDLVARRLQADR